MPIVLDASLHVAVRHENDVHHAAALPVLDRMLEGAWGTILLPEYVVVEVTSVLLKRRGLGPAVRAITDMLEAEEFVFVPCSDVFEEAHAQFVAQEHSNLSIPDQAILAIARREGASHVATVDAGFRKVPGIATVPS